MSRKKQRAVRPGKAPPHESRRNSSSLSQKRWIGLGIVFAVSIVLFLRWRGETPAVPRISIDPLDPTAAQSIQRRLDEVRAQPRSGPAWGRLGVILRSLDFRKEALYCFDAAARFDPRNPRWPYFQALLLAPGSPDGAMARMERSVALCGGEFETTRLRYARMLAEAGRQDEAERQLQELLRTKPDFSPALLMQANLAHTRGDLSNAVALASRCGADRRTSRAAWSLLAALHQRLGDTNAAAKANQQVAALPPDQSVADQFESEAIGQRGDPRDLSDRAQRLLMIGKLQEAAPIITQLVQEHPGFSEGWLLQGRLQLLSQDLVSAEKSIRRHLELDKQSVNGLFQLGMVLLTQGRNSEAATSFTRAIQLKPDFGPAFFNLALALVRSDQKVEAIAPFREAIRHNPERVDSYILLADLLLQLGQKTEALELAKQAELVSPTDRRVATLRNKLAPTP